MIKTKRNKAAKAVGVKLLAVVLMVLLMALALTSCGTGSQKIEQKDESVKAIDFATYDLEGKKSNLSDYFGKPIVLNFWATWCGPCKAELPHFQDAYEKYGDEVKFMMVEVSAGLKGAKQVEEFLKDNKYSVPAFLDEGQEASAKYGISSIPMTLFIDKDGNVADGCVGQLTREFLEDGIGRIKG